MYAKTKERDSDLQVLQDAFQPAPDSVRPTVRGRGRNTGAGMSTAVKQSHFQRSSSDTANIQSTREHIPITSRADTAVSHATAVKGKGALVFQFRCYHISSAVQLSEDGFHKTFS